MFGLIFVGLWYRKIYTERIINMEYYILSLKRSSDIAFFWKRNKHGYECDIEKAGIFSAKEVSELQDELNNGKTTIAVPVSTANKISFKSVMFSALLFEISKNGDGDV